MLFLGTGRGRGGWGTRRGIGVFIPRIRYNGRLRQYESGPGTLIRHLDATMKEDLLAGNRTEQPLTWMLTKVSIHGKYFSGGHAVFLAGNIDESEKAACYLGNPICGPA